MFNFNALGAIPGLAKNIGDVVSTMGNIGIDAAKMEESAAGMKACADGPIKEDAMQLLEHLRSDKVTLLNSRNGPSSPSVFTGWKIKGLMEKYKEGTSEYETLSKCIGRTNMGDINYRLDRLWFDTITTAIGVFVALIIIIIIIFAIASGVLRSKNRSTAVQGFSIQNPPQMFAS
jgi:hypothetical protein